MRKAAGCVHSSLARRRLAASLREPTPEAATATALGPQRTWFSDWLAHSDLEDPFWTPYEASAALSATRIPVLLIGGWHDVFLDQTLEQYDRLDADVALTIGPWTHLETALKAARTADPETLAWFDEHVAGAGSRRPFPVRVHVTGAAEWRTLPTWPPKTHAHTLGLTGNGQLVDETGWGSAEFCYDPVDPTPSLGGRHMSAGAGRRDNRPLESRDDVLTFTSAPLASELEVLGAPAVELHLTTSTAASLFVRLCDVDPRGRSWNVTEAFTRLAPTSGPVMLPLGSCAHRFLPGHRLRLQISGGAYPRFARNPEPCEYTIACEHSHLTLPVGGGVDASA
ncbi:CocE/NonD family hydrolase [Amycolatopsis sp. NPDC050768]|uniref:CocE/NonD family hydrolase n=1 Tax=Amycolatopsis sp. NPDC050768 TaxID=3154839 RepID=UPI0034047B33